jgi:hypothetical protein
MNGPSDIFQITQTRLIGLKVTLFGSAAESIKTQGNASKH